MTRECLLNGRRSLLLGIAVCGLLSAEAGHAGRLSRAQRADLFAHVPPALVRADTDGNRLFDDLEDALRDTPGNRLMDVIVRYRPGSENAAGRVARRILFRFDSDRSVLARLTPAEIRQLSASSAVESIEIEHVYPPTRAQAEASFGTLRATAEFGVTGDADGDPGSYSARDLTIAVLDTGIDPNHPDFAGGKIIAWKDFVDGRPEPYDHDGHGTHVASIAAGAVVNGVGGVAPGASLVALNIMTPARRGGRPSAATRHIIQAIDWCVENRERYGIDVLNLSFGGEGSSDGTDAISRAVDRAAAAGLVVCAAAGNQGPGRYSVDSPAAARGAIAVGAMADPRRGGFYLAEFSSRGPTADGRVKPDICAPGVALRAARAGSSGYTAKDGTSFASPFVAGVATLILQANPALSPAEVKAILKEAAVPFGSPGEDNEYGAGRLDARAAVARACGSAAIVTEGPAHFFAEGTLSGPEVSHVWSVSVTDTRYPVAVTMIMPELEFDLLLNTSLDFDLTILDASGMEVGGSAFPDARQETVSFRPPAPGIYQIVVNAAHGAGRYFLDLSAGAESAPTGATRPAETP